MTSIDKLMKAVTAAENDPHGGKVLLDLKTAKAILELLKVPA